MEGKDFVGGQVWCFNASFGNQMPQNFLYDIIHGIHHLIISRAPRIILSTENHIMPYIYPHKGHGCQFEVSFFALDAQDIHLGIKAQFSYANHVKLLDINTQRSTSSNGIHITTQMQVNPSIGQVWWLKALFLDVDDQNLCLGDYDFFS